jgi:hypothetical protein
MRGTPSSWYRPPQAAKAAVKKRIVVPLFPIHKSACGLGGWPAQPTTHSWLLRTSCCMETPTCCQAAIMTCVSSLSNTPDNRLSPSANAAHTMARLVMLLLPGGVMEF